MFFTQDETKAALSLEEILKTNEQLAAELKQEMGKITSMEIKFNEMETKLKELTDKTKFLERQKQLDDMSIAGLRGIKDDSTKEIIKLSNNIENLKLDYLAEKQLRRLHQQTLHQMDPDNENYNIAKIQIDESKQNGVLEGGIVTKIETQETPKGFHKGLNFWELQVEAKQADQDPVKPKSPQLKSYVIPSKIQKASDDPQAHKNAVRLCKKPISFAWPKKSNVSKLNFPQTGFNFYNIEANTSTSSDPQPSTSTATQNQTQKRTFGEDKPEVSSLSFPSLASGSKIGVSNNSSKLTLFPLPTTLPTFSKQGFSFNLPASSSPSVQGYKFNPCSSYRESLFANSPSPSRSSVDASTNNDNGPKMSDR